MGSEITFWFFVVCTVVALLVSYIVGPITLMDMLVSAVVPQTPGVAFAFIIGSLIAVLMVVPLPILFMVILLPGMVYGFWDGFFILFVSLFVGCVAAFIIGQCCLQEPIRQFLKRGSYVRVNRALLILESDEDSFLLLVLFRFLSMPFFARNFGPTVLDIPLWKLTLSSVPHHMWVAFVFTSFGMLFKDTAHLLRKGGSMGWTNLRWQQVASPIAGLVGSILAAIIAYRIYQRAEAAHADQPPASAPLLGPQRA